MTEYIMFLDESGNHDLNKIANNFPVFCLAGCIFEKEYYHQVGRLLIDQVKIEFWNRQDVIFHSREIRKIEKDFVILNDREIKKNFYDAINTLLNQLQFYIIAVVIDTKKHLQYYGRNAYHPYNMSFEFILERYSIFLRRKNNSTGYIIAE